MITLQPSKTVKENYSINFDALAIALSSTLRMIYGKDIKGSIKIRKSRGWDHYRMGCSEIRLSFDVNKSDEQALSTIIHELRHWQQDKIFKLPDDLVDYYDDTTFERYHNSPIEIDARHFQKVETEVMTMYKSLIDLDEKNEIHDFRSMYKRTN